VAVAVAGVGGGPTGGTYGRDSRGQ